MQEDDVRLALEKQLRRDNIDEMWKYLQDSYYIAEVLRGELTMAELVQRARAIMKAGAPSPKRVGEMARLEGPSRGQDRRWALSQLVAAEMGNDESVVEFRRQHLGNSLIKWSEAQDWIQQHGKVDGPTTNDLTVTIPHQQLDYKGGAEARLVPPLDRLTSFKLARQVLDYAVPGNDWVHRIAVSAGGMLDQLRGLSESLAADCAWQPAQGTIFVLSGVIPLIPTVRVTAPVVSNRGRWAARIVLDIDPAATADEVLELFQAVREQHGLARRRTITPKLARLAAFAMAEHADRPWKERQRRWNEQFPNWKYNQGSNFRRDAVVAKQRLLQTTVPGPVFWPEIS